MEKELENRNSNADYLASHYKTLLQTIQQTLLRRTSNNPLLIGESEKEIGIIIDLFREIVEKGLESYNQVISFDTSTFLASLETLKEQPNIIVFIKNVAELISFDENDYLKFAITSTKLRVIGSTTLAKYTQIIKPDSALSIRFKVIEVS